MLSEFSEGNKSAEWENSMTGVLKRKYGMQKNEM